MEKISQFMTLDHTHLKDLWLDFSVEKDKEKSKILFKKFKDHLITHFKIEEDILSPVFNRHLGIEKGQTEVIKKDHEKIIRLLEKIETNLNKNNETELEYNKKHFIRAVIKHQERESKVQYLLFDKVISEKEWEDISKEIHL